ncbi:Uncharacterized protein OS=Planctomyces limnophilus (strain ATCC 43296 / DSM 3776 / IFAM 1008 / 290) GN=Plim_2787 PE=4 SV=1 [Gemmataceae bacterium]|nr:Uncharacterized protein OS=Planctomyces limnophilus (strain ATCC 43296 / DSM 3776 / IFAM 1008 / 290) GN=Plim_2787 PE=4 SV=1 [Gemmataceae bacterium]VTU01412.1 Uncharacterized protein OS=Planctomyces limnophilus (strain ATCC 43296 / DSM 3776 / IFAM 1008 / 290) GN=Plim_2787 PE=4 SV=1 [Gemmataceae bacterium]
MFTVRIGAAVALLFGLGAAAGCGGDPPSAEVSGSVTFDGKPVEEGGISFSAANGNAPGGGGVIKGGKYTATRVPIGATKVSITAVKVVGQRKAYDAPDSPMTPITEPLLPAKYNTATVLTFEVKPGSQTKDFDLTK